MKLSVLLKATHCRLFPRSDDSAQTCCRGLWVLVVPSGRGQQ